MKKQTITEIMRPYFNVRNRLGSETGRFELPQFSAGSNAPISAHEPKWKKMPDPNRLVRKFSFDDFRLMKAFLNELFGYQEDSGHHAKITIDHRDVLIEVHTKDVEDITEIDVDFASMVDDIYEDTQYFDLSDRDVAV